MPSSLLNLAIKPGQNEWHNYFQTLNSKWWQADWARRSEFKALLNQCIYLNKTESDVFKYSKCSECNTKLLSMQIQNSSGDKSKYSAHKVEKSHLS